MHVPDRHGPTLGIRTGIELLLHIFLNWQTELRCMTDRQRTRLPLGYAEHIGSGKCATAFRTIYRQRAIQRALTWIDRSPQRKALAALTVEIQLKNPDSESLDLVVRD